MARSDDMEALARDIVASYDARVKALGALVKDTHEMLGNFQKGHKDMAAGLKETLAKGEDERLKAFKALQKNIQALQKPREEEVAKLKEDTAKLLDTYQKEEKAMAKALKDALAKGEDLRLKDFQSMLKDIQSRQKERVKEVSDLVAGYTAEREAAAAAWQDLSVKMARKRGILPKVEAAVEVKPVVKAIPEKPKRKPAKKPKRKPAKAKKKKR